MTKFGFDWPTWARKDSPLLRYHIREREIHTLRVLLFQVLPATLLFVLLGYVAATRLFSQTLPQDISGQALAVLRYPSVALQFILVTLTFMLTVSSLGEARRRGRWAAVQVTSVGVENWFYARIAGLFYRVAVLLALVMAFRLVLFLLMLFDLTAYEGRYLHHLLLNLEYGLPLTVGGVVFAEPVALLLLALLLVTLTLLPFAALFLEGAMGMLLSTFTANRSAEIVLQVLWYLGRAALMLALIYWGDVLAANAISLDGIDNSALEMAALWLLTLAHALFGDWGLRLAHLDTLHNLWLVVPYGWMFGLVLWVAVFGQMMLAQRLLRWAMHRAQTRI